MNRFPRAALLYFLALIPLAASAAEKKSSDELAEAFALFSKGAYPQASHDTPLQVYCRSGGRSALAKQLLQQAGYTQVEDLGAYRP
jgi:rhodanese-related sulfurtransferase